MRGLNSTLVMAVLAIGLGAYAYFVESERPPASEEDAPERAFGFEADDVVSLTVTADNGDVTTVSREAPGSDVWNVTAPFTASADANAARAIADGLASLEIPRVVEEETTDLSVYGLASPSFAVGFEAGDAGETVLVGDETPAGSTRYAALRGTARVFLVAGHLESTFNRSSFDLRDRSLLEFTGTDVVGMVIEQADASTIEFSKGDGEWTLVEPTAARADFGVVEGLMGRVGSAEMVAVEQESADTDVLAEFGLESPRVTVTITTGDESHILHVGDENEAGTVYGRDASRAVLFTVDAALVDDLARELETYRKKELFDFRPFNATAVEVERDGPSVRLDKGEGEDGWRRLEPDAGDVAQPAIDNLLSKLSELRAESFVADDGAIDTPLASVTVRFGDDGEEEIRFGRAGETTYAARNDEAGAAVVGAPAVDEVLEAIEEVATAEPAAP